jgi:hypothetical protein
MCQKQHGAAFRTRGRVKAADFEWIMGEELVSFYESSPETYRGFCSVCGSPVVNKFGPKSKAASFNPGAVDHYGIALATLDADPGVRAVRHDFVASKAPWFEITDELPQHEQYPPRPPAIEG